MAGVPWPTGSVAFEAEQGSWREKQEDNMLRTENEVGPAKRRRRTFLPNYELQFDMLLSSTELQAVLDFYDDDLIDGIIPFSATDPRLQTTCDYDFVEPPSWSDAGHDKWLVSLSLRRRA